MRTKTKSSWVNFKEQSEALKRDPTHILDYFLSELGCTGNLGANNEMILTGGFQEKIFARMIKRYMNEYVVCQNCKSMDTKFERKDRLTWLRCDKCKSSRVVQQIASRFVGVKRGERRRARN